MTNSLTKCCGQYTPPVGAAPVPEKATPAPSADLSEALSAASLSQHEAALRELGCSATADLQDLEEADLVEIGLKKLEIRRLMRLVQ